MPYALDLVRLAASGAAGAAEWEDWPGRDLPGASWKAIGWGWMRRRPIVLDRDWAWLRELVVVPTSSARGSGARSRRPDMAAPAALSARVGGGHARPAPADVDRAPRRRHRQPRSSPLDRRRRLARRAGRARGEGALASGWELARGRGGRVIRCAELAGGRYRASDPWYRVEDGMLLRRLSPNNRKVEAEGAACRC